MIDSLGFHGMVYVFLQQ